MAPITKFYNCRLLKKEGICVDDLWVRGGIIIDPQKCFYGERIIPDLQVDCKGKLIAPGYIEVQINGAFGVDFSNSSPSEIQEGVSTVAKRLLAHGVTSFCPTLITSPPHLYHQLLPNVRPCNGSKEGAGVLGLHLEGPFISKAKKGAHPEQCIVTDLQGDTSLSVLSQVYGPDFLDNTAIVTLAPELPSALPVIEQLSRSKRVTVSIGHSEATLKDGEKAVRAGATFITHLFNAMLPFHHRDPGLVGLLTSWRLPADSKVYYGMIADGIHTHPATMRIAHRTHPAGLVLVSDAICAAGFKSGTYRFGQQEMTVVGPMAYVAGTDTLAGSIALLDECVRVFHKAAGCTLAEALEGATLHPALLLGIADKKGTLEYGTDADFIILDEELRVTSTYIAGECVYASTPT